VITSAPASSRPRAIAPLPSRSSERVASFSTVPRAGL
jgi:hypothetical protein